MIATARKRLDLDGSSAGWESRRPNEAAPRFQTCPNPRQESVSIKGRSLIRLHRAATRRNRSLPAATYMLGKIRALTPTVNPVPMKGERVPTLISLMAIRRERVGDLFASQG